MLSNVLQGLGSLAFTAGLFMVAGIGWSLLLIGALAIAAGIAYELKEGGNPDGVRETAE